MSVVVQILGVDPGISGGLAIVAVADGAAPRLVEVIDIPVIGIGAKERVDVAAIRDFIERHKPIRALIERAQAMPKQGSSSGFKYGRAVGAIEAAIALSSVPIEIVEPSAWKKFWHLAGKDKEGGRQQALQLFPAAHAALARKRDHNRAEASLIALYGARTMNAPLEPADREEDMSDTYEMGPMSAVPNVSRMQFNDAVDAIVTWFLANFEDPAECTPWVDGEYAFIYGGPCDAREEIEDAFRSTDEKVIDAAAERIELDGFEWAPHQSRMVAEANDTQGVA